MDFFSRLGAVSYTHLAVRIDHFRGFDQYYSIPYGAETAITGHWEQGPDVYKRQLIDGLFLQVLDTVEEDTPARAATSFIVTAMIKPCLLYTSKWKD